MSTRNIYPLPAPGDFLWCRFPLIEQLGTPGPKPRPALVYALADAEHVVEVVYGTTKKTATHELRRAELVIDPNDPGFAISGLAYRTKFDFDRRVKLPFNSEWFGVAPGFLNHVPPQKMGSMHVNYYALAKAAYDNRKK